jgi:hypothetical protein
MGMSRAWPVLVVSMVLTAACDSPRGQLETHDIAIAARSLVSLAAEAGMLSEQLALDNVSSDFAAVHQKALGEESLKIAKEVAKPVPDKLRETHQALAALNARFQTAITRVADAHGKPGELERLQLEFKELGARASPLKGP